jgi:hypothetical protein
MVLHQVKFTQSLRNVHRKESRRQSVINNHLPEGQQRQADLAAASDYTTAGPIRTISFMKRDSLGK